MPTPRTLARTLGTVVLLGAVGVASAYYVRTEVFPMPCTEPILYRVGDLDKRFGVSEAAFIDAMSDAAEIWNTAAGKPVLALSPEGTLPVSLVFDERQAVAVLSETIDDDQARYDQKRALVDTLIATHESKSRAYETRVAQFEAAQAKYEAEVARWNKQGGAPPNEFERLERAKREFVRTQNALNAEADRLNAESQRINAEVAELNILAGKVNQKVETYNEVAGKEFDQGQYIEDKNGARITIYEFRTRDQLVRALSHEFGHALGVMHTEDPQSLMYPYNSGRSLALAEEDRAALREVCKLGE